MQKRKLFAILSIIITISLIGLSAQCGAPSEAPTIELKIYDGPDYLESDKMCYYRVEAIVTGMPDPEIEFEVDDNINQLGPGRVEVGVEVGDTGTLTATATNSAGIANASITLTGECSEDIPDEEDITKGAVEKEYKKERPKEIIEKPKRKYKRKTKNNVKYNPPKISLKKDGYELIITEKPQAATKIASALGDSTKRDLGGVAYYELTKEGKDLVIACTVGHLLTLRQNISGYSVPIFDIDWVPNYMVRKKDFTKKT